MAPATVVVFTCAASAGVHAGIVPEHLREEPRLGAAFIVTVLALLATGGAVSFRPGRSVALIAALVLGGLIVAYVASRTGGIPLRAPEPEAVDAVGVAAVCIELPGLLCALWLAHAIGRLGRWPFLEEVSP